MRVRGRRIHLGLGGGARGRWWHCIGTGSIIGSSGVSAMLFKVWSGSVDSRRALMSVNVDDENVVSVS